MSEIFKDLPHTNDNTLWERGAGKVVVTGLRYMLGQIRIQIMYKYDYGFDIIGPEV